MTGGFQVTVLGAFPTGLPFILGCSGNRADLSEEPSVWESICEMTQSWPGPHGDLVQLEVSIVGDHHGIYLIDSRCARTVRLVTPSFLKGGATDLELRRRLDQVDGPPRLSQRTKVRARVEGQFLWKKGKAPEWMLVLSKPVAFLDPGSFLEAS